MCIKVEVLIDIDQVFTLDIRIFTKRVTIYCVKKKLLHLNLNKLLYVAQDARFLCITTQIQEQIDMRVHIFWDFFVCTAIKQSKQLLMKENN